MWSVNLVVHDGEAHSSLVSINLAGTLTFAQLSTWVTAFVPLLNAVIDGTVRSVTVSRVVTSFATAAGADSDVEMKAKLIFNVANTVKRLVMGIPTFLHSLVLPNSDDVDQTDVDVDALLDALVTGITVDATAYGALDSEARDVESTASAKEDYGRKRR